MIINNNQWQTMKINDNQWQTMIIDDNQLISHETSWWDISVVQVSLLCQRYPTKSVGEIFLWYKFPCYVNDISRQSSKTSASLSRLSIYFCLRWPPFRRPFNSRGTRFLSILESICGTCLIFVVLCCTNWHFLNVIREIERWTVGPVHQKIIL